MAFPQHISLKKKNKVKDFEVARKRRKEKGLDLGWANYGPPNAFLWPAKNLYQAKTLPLFSLSNRLIPYKLFINM